MKKENNKKRILVLNYEFPPLGGGASPVSYEIAKRLSETKEFDIDVVTMGFKKLAKYQKINDNLRVHRVKCWRSKKEICHPWEQLTYLISGYFKCRELLKKNKYDICHCHFIIPTGILALKLKNKFGLDYVITSHGSDVLGYNPRFKKLYPLLINYWKKILDNAKKIITPSDFLNQKILEVYKNINQDKIEVIYNGIEKNKFKPLEKEKYILLVIRLFVNKGIQDFIKAVSGLNLGAWRVKIIGDGPYRKNLEKLIKKHNLKDKIKLSGWMDNESSQLKELYGRASIFVLPSHFENMNITLLEAMQAGCSIIASRVGGNVEVIGNTGELFQVKNSTELRKKIKLLVDDENKRKGYLEKTQERATNIFDWDIMVNKYINLLK